MNMLVRHANNLKLPWSTFCDCEICSMTRDVCVCVRGGGLGELKEEGIGLLTRSLRSETHLQWVLMGPDSNKCSSQALKAYV